MVLNAEDLNRPWPSDGLERVKRCPVCDGEERELLHQGLQDKVFFCARGTWTLYRCQKCGSGYLDPRPTRATIGLAYESYFTHDITQRDGVEDLGWLRRIKRNLANGYRNHRFGMQEHPASRMGVLAAMLLPSHRATLEAEGRHIPKVASGATLLDIGCGNGDFLDFARRAGWTAVGLDPDPKAVAVAQCRGLDARLGDVEALDLAEHQFDGITLSHAIEHVHDPLQVLRACYRLLRSGGWIWLDTPNLEAEGHHRYGVAWRGLEPPRHLALFTRASMQRLLEGAGFCSVQDQAPRPLCSNIFSASEAISEGRDPWKASVLSGEGLRAASNAEKKARREARVREFITVKAWKKN